MEVKLMTGALGLQSSQGAEDWVLECIREGKFSSSDCVEVLRRSLGELPIARRSMLHRQGRAVISGLYAVGGFGGLSNVARQGKPDECWTTIYISHNTGAPVHRDLRNAPEFPIVVRAVGSFRGGGLWLEDLEDAGTVCKVLPDGTKRSGRVYDIRSESLCLLGIQMHASEDWDGDSWVLSAFVPRDVGEPVRNYGDQLRGLGFPIDRVLELKTSNSDPSTIQVAQEAALQIKQNIGSWGFRVSVWRDPNWRVGLNGIGVPRCFVGFWSMSCVVFRGLRMK